MMRENRARKGKETSENESQGLFAREQAHFEKGHKARRYGIGGLWSEQCIGQGGGHNGVGELYCLSHPLNLSIYQIEKPLDTVICHCFYFHGCVVTIGPFPTPQSDKQRTCLSKSTP